MNFLYLFVRALLCYITDLISEIMKRILTALALSVVATCCTPRQEPPQVNDEVVIIVDGLAYSDKFYREYGKEEGAYSTMVGRNPFTFVSSDPEEAITEVRVNGDTTTISLDADHMFVKYYFNPFSTSDFIVHKGDTVLVKRDTAKIHSRAQPQISILNREPAPLDVGYRQAYLERFGSYQGITLEEAGGFFLFLFDVYDFDLSQGKDAFRKIDERHHNDVIRLLEEENLWIDSLSTSGMFSESAYMYFKERVRWSLKQKNIERGYRGTISESRADSVLRADYDQESFEADVYGFYKEYINSVAYSCYFPKYIQISQGSTCDWEYTYDKLQKDTLIKGTVLYRQYLLNTLDGMLQDFPKHRSRKYVDSAIAVADSSLALMLRDRYKEAFAEDTMVENKLLLMSPDGTKTDLTAVLNGLEGKVIYVDFWASWCRPCCAEMEPAALLRERLKGEDVEFIYLSKDEEHSRMCGSLEQLRLQDCEVWRILNPKAAKFIYEYNIELIPRYMIIDRNGRIINDNAPRPSSEDIYSILNEL